MKRRNEHSHRWVGQAPSPVPPGASPGEFADGDSSRKRRPGAKYSAGEAPAGTGGGACPTHTLGFTLLELLIAVAIFAIVLGAINSVFFAALRLRNRANAMVDKSVPVEQALNIIRRDLANIVPPGTNLLEGPLQTTSSSNIIIAATGPAFYCSTGLVDETSPWADIQRVTYALVESTNRFQGRDLVRYADRNLLAVTPEPPLPQILLNGVRDIVFSFYDGSQWRTYWDSTTEDPKLPGGIKVEIQLEPDADDPNAPLPPLLQLVVPVMVSAPTNSTTQASSGGQQ